MPKFLTWWKGKGLHELFEIGVLLKGANAILEIGIGVALLFVNVGDILRTLIEDQLVEDPDSFLARQLMRFASHFSPHAQFFAALYLLSHGAVKTVLVVGLLKRKIWAYPASLAVLGLFILYQTIKLIQTHSIALLLLNIFDISLVYLIWREYRRMRHLWHAEEKSGV